MGILHPSYRIPMVDVFDLKKMYNHESAHFVTGQFTAGSFAILVLVPHF